jgi:hypothetical protein
MNECKLTYIFARVRGDYIEKIAALHDLVSDIRGIFQIDCLAMSLTAQPRLWSDGFVIAFMSDESPESISEELNNSLGNLSYWTICQGISSFLEHPKEGPLKDAAWALRDKPLSFFFLLAKDNEFAFGRHTESVIKLMKSSVAYSVFSFSDGEILAVSTAEPPKITIHRCSRALQLFSHWVFCSPDGESFRDDSEKDCWMDTDLLIVDKDTDLDP